MWYIELCKSLKKSNNYKRTGEGVSAEKYQGCFKILIYSFVDFKIPIKMRCFTNEIMLLWLKLEQVTGRFCAMFCLLVLEH